MGLHMSNKENVINEKNKKSELAAPATPNPHIEIKAILKPSTELSIDCLVANERSYIKDRKWAGQRAAEIVNKKFGGYDKVTNEQLSLATKQAWDEQIAVCQSLTKNTGNPEPTNEKSGNPESPKDTIDAFTKKFEKSI